jgi:hypothetical protein
MKRNFLFAIVGAFATALCSHAALIPPGDFGTTVPVSGTSEAASPQLAGTIIDERKTPYSYLVNDGSLTALYGTFESRVVRSSVDGTLDFYWRILPTANPFGGAVPDGIIKEFKVYAPGVGQAVPNVDWRTDLPGITAPEEVHRDGSNQYTYRFPLGVGVGAPSRWSFLDTALPSYYFGTSFNMVDDSGNGTPTSTTVAPIIPEPATASLLLIGATIVFRSRRDDMRGRNRVQKCSW